MRRWPTWLVVGALAALGAVAAADAIRDSGSGSIRRTPPPTASVASDAEPITAAMGGALYFSDADDDCRLSGITLPDLGNPAFDPATGPPPKLRSCRFSLSPDGLTALPGTVAWSPRGGLYARERDGTIELGSPSSRRTLRFPGRSPAFKPDGTFTYVDRRTVVEWTTDCPPGSALFTLPADNATARCRRTVLTLDELAGLLLAHSDRITTVAWLAATRLVAFARTSVRGAGDIQTGAVLVGSRLVGASPRIAAADIRIETSPRGSYFAVWAGNALVGVYDSAGRTIILPLLSGIRALTWSPDERWTAVATRRSVYVFRTNEGEARVRRLPIVARDLAWR